MRQLNIISPTTEALPNLGLLTNVVELTYYDMIYIYHRLKHKSRIELRREHNHIFDKNAVEVYFEGFKLGYISLKVNSIVAKQMDRGNTVLARVKSVKKYKNTSLSGLDIEVMVM
jgi:hypothetical protein|tara:strand:+ start:528 stop:872 length:345 start_codon:yes stop_codon:yes gene_type:complete